MEPDLPVASNSKEEPEELNLRILRPLLGYLEVHQGRQVAEAVVAAAGISTGALELEDRWVSHAQFETVLAEGRARLASDEEFVQACRHDLDRLYGPLTLLLRFVSIRRVVETMNRTSHLVTRISRFESEPGRRPNELVMRYVSTRPESRLSCLSRRAQWGEIPRVIWGQPRAVITERRCIAWGDPCCEVLIRFQEPLRWRAPVAGALAGLGSGVGLWAVLGVLWPLPSLVALGLGVGLGMGWRRERRVRDAFVEAKTEEAERFVMQHLEATSQLLQLHQRREEWTAEVERHSQVSSHTLGEIISRLETLRTHDPQALREISHDLRNPLTLIQSSASALADSLGDDDRERRAYVKHLRTGVQRLTEMLDEVSRLAASPPVRAPEAGPLRTIETAPLQQRYRRELGALTVGRDLQVEVALTREAPASIECRAEVFDRVMDNLLTNAAKYTERGRIAVEIGGTPGHLCIKVSDTGRGIHRERLEAVLTGASVDDAPLIGDSRGVGLSVVVRHLDRLGGRLEVLSRPELGTTFWVYVPKRPEPRVAVETREAGEAEDPIERVVGRVVTIRDSSGEHRVVH
jgi:signal transduction histidine kinase